MSSNPPSETPVPATADAEVVEAEVAEPDAAEAEVAEAEVVEAEVVQPDAAEAEVVEPDAVEAPAPKPRAPKPGAPKPGAFRAPSPLEVAAHATHPVRIPVASEVTPEQLAAASAFGTVADGVVTVTDGEATREVGPASGDTPLEPYVRAYYELVAGAERFHARLVGSELNPKDIEEGLATLTASVAEPAVVGDLAALRARVVEIEAEAAALRERLLAERKVAREAALAAREAVAVRAEEIAAKPLGQVHWKNDTAELRALLDSWKAAQQSGVRVPKEAERALWKRFTAARSSFEKARKAHFAELDSAQALVTARKEALVAKAEELSQSTDWDRTARAFRDLMTDWRAAGRGRKSIDDALWKRFQGAQDAFFAARRATADAAEEALAGNVDAKQRVVEEAEALLPIKDLATAKSALRAIQDRFDAAGEVPRPVAGDLARRLGAVEKAVREAEDARWKSRNPELEARASGALAQLHEGIADLERQLAAATTDAQKAKLTEALEARKAWLKQIEGVVK